MMDSETGKTRQARVELLPPSLEFQGETFSTSSDDGADNNTFKIDESLFTYGRSTKEQQTSSIEDLLQVDDVDEVQSVIDCEAVSSCGVRSDGDVHSFVRSFDMMTTTTMLP